MRKKGKPINLVGTGKGTGGGGNFPKEHCPPGYFRNPRTHMCEPMFDAYGGNTVMSGDGGNNCGSVDCDPATEVCRCPYFQPCYCESTKGASGGWNQGPY